MDVIIQPHGKNQEVFLKKKHVQHLTKSPEETRIELWIEKLEEDHPQPVMGITPLMMKAYSL